MGETMGNTIEAVRLRAQKYVVEGCRPKPEAQRHLN